MIISAVYFQSLAADVGDNGVMEYSLQKAVVAPFILTSCLLFGLMLLLGVAKDLGKKTTAFICVFSIVMTLVYFALTLLEMSNMANVNVMFTLGQRAATSVLLVLVAGVMAKFKYIDKAERGTK